MNWKKRSTCVYHKIISVLFDVCVGLLFYFLFYFSSVLLFLQCMCSVYKGMVIKKDDQQEEVDVHSSETLHSDHLWWVFLWAAFVFWRKSEIEWLNAYSNECVAPQVHPWINIPPSKHPAFKKVFMLLK